MAGNIFRGADVSEESNEIETNQSSQTNDVGVGALLHATRERIGESVEEAAAKLRINRRYIQALEDGRIEDLPGATYAIGFVRTYADYLGLDSEEVVRRFKDESDGVSTTTELDFPAPVPESGIPSGSVLIAAVVVAALAYGGWYLTASEDSAIVEPVPPVPERLAEETPAPEETAPEQAVAEETAEEAVVEQAESEQEVAEEQAVADTAPSVEPAVQEEASGEEAASAATPVEEAKADVEDVASEAASAVQSATEEAVAETVEQGAQAPAADTSAEATVVEEETQAEPAVEAEATPAPESVSETVVESTPEPVVEQAAAAPAPAPVVAAETAKPQGRIVLRAISNSWIQITDSESGKTVVTRMLRKGRDFAVEDRPGLQLSTGNAGALAVLVDGVEVPAIGKPGEVVRNLDLDAEALKGGEQ